MLSYPFMSICTSQTYLFRKWYVINVHIFQLQYNFTLAGESFLFHLYLSYGFCYTLALQCPFNGPKFIQELWLEKLNPEVSTLKEVVSAAEIIEIAQSVMDDMGPRSSRHGSQQFKSIHSDMKHSKENNSRQPKMSHKERKRHRAEGLCFHCHKPGHFVRDCPEASDDTSSDSSEVTSECVDSNSESVESMSEMSEDSNQTDEIDMYLMEPTSLPSPATVEMGCPETITEVHDYFVPLDPGQRKEGWKGAQESQKSKTYSVDPLFQKILDSPEDCENFIISDDGIIRIRLRFCNNVVICMPNTCIDGKRLQEMIIDQLHSMLVHRGAHKILSYFREFVRWTFMVEDVEVFCVSCKTCRQTNLRKAINVDFVELLPGSKDQDGDDWAILMITEDFGNSSYCVNLPDLLKQWGVHNIFHVSLLHTHVSNEDRLFTGLRDEQIRELRGANCEWMINYILTHRGSTELKFLEVKWSVSDQTWVSHLDIERTVALGDQLLGCPCPTCHSFSLLKLSPRRKSVHRIPLSSSIYPNAPNTLLICHTDPTLFSIIHMARQGHFVNSGGMRWNQAQSFFVFDNSIHRRLHTFQPVGYAEFRQAYELDHLDSTARPTNSNNPVLNLITVSPDTREYLGTRRSILAESEGGLGEGQLMKEQRMVLNHPLWDSEARSARYRSIAARAYKIQEVKRHNTARGPITDRTHQMSTLLEHEHFLGALSSANTSITLFPTSSASTLAKLETPATPVPVVDPNHVPLPITTLPPSLCRPSVLDTALDSSILTDEDLEMLNGQMNAGTTDEDAEGESKAEEDCSEF